MRGNKPVLEKIDQAPLRFYLLFAFTLGLAPFAPPHLLQKIGMLIDGSLHKPIDVFDLLLHGLPWLLLLLKLWAMSRRKLADKV